MERLVCLVIGYVFGLFQTGYIYGRLHGIDIRNYGSGNAGTTNMLRTLGTGAGAVTLLGDAFKCVIAVMVTRMIFRSTQGDILPLLGLYTAAGVILGHNFPFYLHFRGGKGIAATAGLILSMDPIMTLIALAVFVATLFLTHYVSLGSLLVYICFMAELLVFGQSGAFAMEQRYLNEMYILGGFLMLLAFWMHRQNIKRLLHGEERRTYLFKKKSETK
ncbi:MAG: glycerol-3-phosphate 1-O-acyltransferase PlsY [Lachnospiraceae bacterium]|uniref:glycerol-3-phosphate 1-O-acyltransferase PlsY n=1 Tax=Parablautia sp. Marseille-Q6255 TaxID=3039593 RepID=UPI0024BC1B4D|nr:glycerol-3-phosphate 1-O-acyltransferase PlsY [Parablautia sp. Marseille-Q6255]